MRHPSKTSLADFAEVARGYCSWCEGESLGLDPASQAACWLARLYVAALALPEWDAENAEGLPDLPQPTETSGQDSSCSTAATQATRPGTGRFFTGSIGADMPSAVCSRSTACTFRNVILRKLDVRTVIGKVSHVGKPALAALNDPG